MLCTMTNLTTISTQLDGTSGLVGRHLDGSWISLAIVHDQEDHFLLSHSMPNVSHFSDVVESYVGSEIKGMHRPGSQQLLRNPAAAAPTDVRAFSAPPEIWSKVVAAGQQKATQGPIKLTLLSMLAGAYIGLGFALCMIGAGQLSPRLREEEPGLFNILYGIYGFPFGLSLVVLAGAELFTSNVMFMAAAWLDRKVSALTAILLCVVCYLFNLAGALLLVRLMVWGHIFGGREAFTVSLGVKKVNLGFAGALVRGMLCNWLVCLAVWLATAAQDITGKAVGIFLPISAFVSSGYEHSVANMFGVPMGIALGAPFNFWHFVAKNLVPVTLGNTISAAGFVALVYALCYGVPGKTIEGSLHAWSKSVKKQVRAAVSHAHVPHVSFHCDWPDHWLGHHSSAGQANAQGSVQAAPKREVMQVGLV